MNVVHYHFLTGKGFPAAESLDVALLQRFVRTLPALKPCNCGPPRAPIDGRVCSKCGVNPQRIVWAAPIFVLARNQVRRKETVNSAQILQLSCFKDRFAWEEAADRVRIRLAERGDSAIQSDAMTRKYTSKRSVASRE
jgi:hypothetical protein